MVGLRTVIGIMATALMVPVGVARAAGEHANGDTRPRTDVPAVARRSEAEETDARALKLTASATTLAELGIPLERLEYHLRIETGRRIEPRGELALFVDSTTDSLGVALTLVVKSGAEGHSQDVTMSRVIPVFEGAIAERPRVIALAVAEMLRAAPRGVPAGSVTLASSESERSTLPPAPASPPTTRRVFTVEARGGSTYATQEGTPFVDGRLNVETPVYSSIYGMLGGGVSAGSARDPAGEVRLLMPTFALGLRGRSVAPGVVSFGAGPTLEGGWAFATGQSSASRARESSGDTLTLRASLDVDVRVELAKPLFWILGLHAGAMLRGVELRSDDRTVMGATGITLGASTGLGLRL